MRSKLHVRNAAERDARETAPKDTLPSGGIPPASPDMIPLDLEQDDELVFDAIGFDKPNSTSISDSKVDLDPFAAVHESAFGMFDADDNLGTSEESPIDWDDYLWEAINQLCEEPVPRDFVQKRRAQVSQDEWYPFKSKEYLIGSLIMGYMHHIMSREVYGQLQLIISLTGCRLPNWTTLRKCRESIREVIGLEVKQSTSVFNNECYSISIAQLLRQGSKWLKHLSPDLRAPMAVNRKKHFYLFEPAQLFSGDIVVPIFFYEEGSQLYAKCAVPQMDDLPGQPEKCLQIPAPLPFDSSLLQSISLTEFDLIYSEIEVEQGMLSNICSNKLWETGSATTSRELPNPWREIAGTKVIRHMPINLYADDTSGNLSKRWNKHISYYLTLSGLPPSSCKMQYNCHFVTTSNQAGVLELAEPIVNEMNLIARQGFTAYDSRLDEDVLVMSIVLCFQGDSPMHAEVTNTFVPNVCLNPCRMCSLHLSTLDDKRKQDYVRSFLHLDASGNHAPVASRSWIDIRNQTYDLWETAQDGVKCHFEDGEKQKGVRDTCNREFVEKLHDKNCPHVQAEVIAFAAKEPERIFNPFLRLIGFDGCKDTPVEILHVFLLGVVKYMTHDFMKSLKPPQLAGVLASWQAFNIDSLNISSIQAKYLSKHFCSLIGKDFNIILQTAPFVLYQYMDDSQRAWWNSLCMLGTYIFETCIHDMVQYIADLRKHINIFLWHTINRSAQWINKPKFHMLIHLPESIERFGPACLFSTENFESFNSLLRTASVHSNRLHPGRDIALSFLNFQALRLLLSSARIFNSQTNKVFSATAQITRIFSDNILIQKSMGYNQCLAPPSNSFPYVLQSPLAKCDKQPIPNFFNQFPNSHVSQVFQLRLSEKDIVRRGFFVLVAPGCETSKPVMGRVESLWEISQADHRSRYVVHMSHFLKSGIHPFYRMRILNKAETSGYYWVTELMDGLRPIHQDLKSCLNVQHDCQTGKCEIKTNNKRRRENEEAAPSPKAIVHLDDNQFILNSASFHSSVSHRQVASLGIQPILPSAWQIGITHGMRQWAATLRGRQLRYCLSVISSASTVVLSGFAESDSTTISMCQHSRTVGFREIRQYDCVGPAPGKGFAPFSAHLYYSYCQIS
ncbi:hypothetical protein PTTG_02286 [Puccinia triticina 1-1 BBBD Race 1]|uniref:Uncharacterized protein n=1 Tax=Puccinia triticina (isolate 1-1 / race 1 (BBBD)) TaxID=630390 RepID=A0A0C4ENE5_PUCT1|nr:hypothetical protein PTTG_02286 [Puccinia triticina 1-1 BBBD Race 1]